MLKTLNASYFRKLLGREPKAVSDDVRCQINDSLAPFGLRDAEDANTVVELPLPDWAGSLAEEIADATKPYEDGWEGMVSLVTSVSPSFPSNFNCPSGWSFWDKRDRTWKSLSKVPSGKTMILDMESVKLPSGKWHPTCAVCMSSQGWLVWKADFSAIEDVSVIPFTTDNHIVGYNVSYDRSFLAPEYLLAESGNKFYDLMSMWVVTHGMTNQQRTAFGTFSDDEDDMDKPMWAYKTSTNGLAAAYKFYTGKALEKGVRDQIVGLGLDWVSEHIAEVIGYCALDVLATHELGGHLVPAYSAHRPSDINRYGLVALGSCWVPLSADRYEGYYDRCESSLVAAKDKINELLMDAATAYMSGDKKDESCLDWELAKTGKNKGLPVWYRKVLSDYVKGNLTLSQRFAPIVLETKWDGEDLYWEDGWRTAQDFVPHPTNRGAKVTNMFLKDFADLYETGFISVPAEVKPLVAEKISTLNWVSLRKRVAEIHTESPEGFPVAIPMMVVNGTATGRATDKIWQVAPNPKKNRIGTELKSLVAPIPGYVFVGADVDGQESWLAACHGDEQLGVAGSTPFGFMVAGGAKSKKTDAPSVISKTLGISRDNAKPMLYGTLYGQGLKGGVDVLLKSDPSMGETGAKHKASDFLKVFKGGKNNYGSYFGGMASAAFDKMERLADGKRPATILTRARMTFALADCQDYKPTRVNWLVQGSGVDFRDLLVLLTRSFYAKLGVIGRLIVTVHDEIRTMVKEEHVDKAVYALQLAHLYTRAAFIDAHGLDDIAAGVAWFSEVDVDAHCLRKDPKDPQVTPTQEALPLGYTVSPQQLYDRLSVLRAQED